MRGQAWASWPPRELWDMRGLRLEEASRGDNTPWMEVNSWYMTERVVEALVALVELRQARPSSALQSSRLLDELTAEVEWRIAQTAGAQRTPLLKALTELHERRMRVGPSASIQPAQELLEKVIATSQANGAS